MPAFTVREEEEGPAKGSDRELLVKWEEATSRKHHGNQWKNLTWERRMELP